MRWSPIRNMNKHFQTTGIIIRKFDFNEADRIISVLTDDRGKIDCIAKGARRLTSKFCGRLELFSHIQINCFQGRDLSVLNEVHLLSGLAETKDTKKHRALFYIAELTNRLIQQNQQIDGMYPLLIEMLNSYGPTEKTDALLYSYIIKILTLTGFLPQWNKCSSCGNPLELEYPVMSSFDHSNPICHCCATASDKKIDIGLIKWINYMQKNPLSDTIRVKADEAQHESVWQWLKTILTDILQKPINAQEFLELTI